MKVTEKVVAALAEVGYQAADAGRGQVLCGLDVPPGVALRACQIAHGNHAMTMSQYIAHLKATATYPVEAANYDLWLKRHGVTIDEVSP